MSYDRPTSLADALAIRAEVDCVVLAGGTDVYPARATNRAWGRMRHKPVLDISAIDELKGIDEADGHYRIGALATWSELIRRELPPVFDALKAAAREVGGQQIQNRGTIVGNICNASPAADGVPALLCHDAEVVLAGPEGSRQTSLTEFITGNRETTCGAREIVTELRLPKLSDRSQSAFLKLGSRHYLVISIAMAAGIAVIDGGVLDDIRLAVGACSPVACRLPELEQALIGRSVAEAVEMPVLKTHLGALSPIDDVRASAGYRLAAANELTMRLLRDLLQPNRRQAA